jgi:hypothetical protein
MQTVCALARATTYFNLADISDVLPNAGCSVSTTWSLSVFCFESQTQNVSLALRKRHRKENTTRGAESEGLAQCLIKQLNPSLILMSR